MSESHNGLGLASEAVHEIKRAAFEKFGLAPAYLKIAGKWRDNLMFPVLNPAPI